MPERRLDASLLDLNDGLAFEAPKKPDGRWSPTTMRVDRCRSSRPTGATSTKASPKMRISRIRIEAMMCLVHYCFCTLCTSQGIETGQGLDTGLVTLSKDEFAEAAQTFGYRYTRLSSAGALPSGEAPLFEGSLGMFSFPSGLNVCASDLTALRESTHEGVVPRSLTVALVLDGVESECAFDVRHRMPIRPGRAMIVSVVDGVRMANTVTAGQRSRCLLVTVRPEDLADDELADGVDGALRSTSIVPFIISARVAALANELFAPSLAGRAGRLLAESCALELLARSPVFNRNGYDGGAASVNRRDRARIMGVRDLLMTEPDREHHLCDLARRSGMSVTTLKTKFAAVFGQPVFAFLRDVRLERACAGLEREGWTVAQAAYYAGYRHPTSFAYAFRRKFGISPSACRDR